MVLGIVMSATPAATWAALRPIEKIRVLPLYRRTCSPTCASAGSLTRSVGVLSEVMRSPVLMPVGVPESGVSLAASNSTTPGWPGGVDLTVTVKACETSPMGMPVVAL